MTEAEAVKAFMSGAQVMVVEFRGSRVDHLAWRDDKTGLRREADLCKHTVEAGSKSFAVNERMPETWDAEAAKAAFEAGKFSIQKGARCVLEFTSCGFGKRGFEADGKLIPLSK